MIRAGHLWTGLLAVTAVVTLASGCSSSDGTAVGAPSPSGGEVVRMWVEPERVECTGVGPMECLQVSYTEDGQPELFYSPIEGFEFVEGTTYVIDVRVSEVASPPADGSSLSYALVDVVSQTVVSQTPAQ